MTTLDFAELINDVQWLDYKVDLHHGDSGATKPFKIHWESSYLDKEPVWDIPKVSRGYDKLSLYETAVNAFATTSSTSYYPKPSKKPNEPKLDLTEDAVEDLLGLICK